MSISQSRREFRYLSLTMVMRQYCIIFTCYISYILIGTFKPGMMVKEFDEVVFSKDVGVVHGPIETQFGSHLILITRRYEGEGEKK